jgi:repressor LexA
MTEKPDQSGKLAPKQAKILDFIRDEIAQSGRAPTYRDIAKHFGYDAVGTVQDHIRALIRKGFLEKAPGVARGIQLAFRSASKDIPILGSVPAGLPVEAIEDTMGSLSVPGKIRGELFALKVVGESMIDAGILNGDFVVVRKQTHAESGQIVVAMIDGEATVKYLERKAGRVRLLPANARFSPIEINPQQENVIVGVVMSVQRFL